MREQNKSPPENKRGWTWENSWMAHPLKSIYLDLALAGALVGGGWLLVRQIPENNPEQEKQAVAAILKSNQSTNLNIVGGKLQFDQTEVKSELAEVKSELEAIQQLLSAKHERHRPRRSKSKKALGPHVP